MSINIFMSKKSICSAPSIAISISIKEHQHNFSDLQQTLGHSIPKVCNKCKVSDTKHAYYNIFNKIKSVDVDIKENKFNPELKYLHIGFNNKCNLACRMCSSQFSSLHWQEQFGESKVIDFVKPHSRLYNSIYESLSTIEYLYMTGGEILFDQESWKLLNFCVEKNYAKNITLQINTNGTIKLSEKEIKTLKSFKDLEFHISMDGIEKMAEYTRTGLVWEKWIKNFERYHKLFPNLHVVITASVYNIFEIDKTVKFFDNYNVGSNVNILTYPYGLEISSLNNVLKKELLLKYKSSGSKYDSVCSFLKQDCQTIDTKSIILEKEKNAIGKYPNFSSYSNMFPEYWSKF
jgi:molybdenum cofactor biosynthesis enzyme MoaA